MSYSGFLKFLEIIQHSLFEGSLTIGVLIIASFVIRNFGVLVFQVDGFRFLELVVEQITVSEIRLNRDGVLGRELQSLASRCNRFSWFSIQQLIPREV